MNTTAIASTDRLATLHEDYARTDTEYQATHSPRARQDRARAYLAYHAALVAEGVARAIPCDTCEGEGQVDPPGCSLHSHQGGECTCEPEPVPCPEHCLAGAWPCTWCGSRPAVVLSTWDRDPRCRPCHLAWCEGCDETYDEEPEYVADYLVTDHEGRTERVRYCRGCADLAAMDWNGETRAIVPAAA